MINAHSSPSASPTAQSAICNHGSPISPMSARHHQQQRYRVYRERARADGARRHFDYHALSRVDRYLGARGDRHALALVERAHLTAVASLRARQLDIHTAALYLFYGADLSHMPVSLFTTCPASIAPMTAGGAAADAGSCKRASGGEHAHTVSSSVIPSFFSSRRSVRAIGSYCVL